MKGIDELCTIFQFLSPKLFFKDDVVATVTKSATNVQLKLG